jgi:hypothetical protein
VVVLRRLGVLGWPLGVTFALVTVIAILTYGAIRFREPAETSLVVLSAVAVERLLRRLVRRSMKHSEGVSTARPDAT